MTLKERIMQHEGLRLKPYRCTAGKLTIGYGRNLDDVGISKEEAELMLDNDLSICNQECFAAFDWYSEMDQVRRGVILEMCFNLGLPRLKGFKKMLLACEHKNYSVAADEMLSSRWAGQVGQRAKTLADIMRKGVENV